MGRNCDGCEGWFHLSCVSITQKLSKQLSVWSCLSCRQPSNLGTASISASMHHGHVEPTQPSNVELLQKLRSTNKVIPRIPKGARRTVADSLTKIITTALESNNVQDWKNLFCFALVALRQPCPTNDSKNFTTAIKRQVNDYVVSHNLTTSAPAIRFHERESGNNSIDARNSLRRQVDAKLSDLDIKGAVRRVASDDTFAGYSEEIYGKLSSKHPSTPTDFVIPPDPVTPPIIVNESVVATALSRMNSGSAGGPDGIRPRHLKDLVHISLGESGQHLLCALTKIINVTLSGQIPDHARDFFYSAALFALNKKDGGIRPISVGNTFRRLASRIAVQNIQSHLLSILQPYQLGFACQGGSEAAVHAIRLYAEDAKNSKNVIVKLDVANAFNTIRRDHMLSVVLEEIPQIYPMLHQAYSNSSPLLFGDRVVKSSTGLQQGDPFGPPVFALGINKIVKNIKAPVNIWYLDDATICGPPDIVAQCISEIVPRLSEIGLVVNPRKSELTFLSDSVDKEAVLCNFSSILPDIRNTALTDLDILGAPVFMTNLHVLLDNKQQCLGNMINRLKLLDAHPAYMLLKNCFAIPKMMYILRTTKAFSLPESLAAIDKTIREGFSDICNVHCDDTSWPQAVLPIKHGGIGLRRTCDIALPAYISSVHVTASLVDTILSNSTGLVSTSSKQDIMDVWMAEHGADYVAENKNSQKCWDNLLIDRQIEVVSSNASTQLDLARINSAKQPHTGAWLDAIPVGQLGTRLTNESFRIGIALRIGANTVCPSNKCKCGATIDTRGLHHLSCRFSAGRFSRHGEINNIVCRALNSTGRHSILEPTGLDRGDGKRPDGMTTFPYSSGRCLVWDATVTDTYANSNLDECSVSAGSAANKAEDLKRRKYATLAANYCFRPIAFETTGVAGHQTIKTINKIGEELSDATGDKRETSWLWQRLGIALVRGNAACLLADPH